MSQIRKNHENIKLNQPNNVMEKKMNVYNDLSDDDDEEDSISEKGDKSNCTKYMDGEKNDDSSVGSKTTSDDSDIGLDDDDNMIMYGQDE